MVSVSNSSSTCFGSHITTSGKKIQNAIAKKNIKYSGSERYIAVVKCIYVRFSQYPGFLLLCITATSKMEWV
jgi:hypothetical protein